jgi:hypothetical protein
MKLQLEESIKVAVEVNKQPFISAEEAVLFQNTENDNELFFYIKNKAGDKEIKIKLWKEDKVEDLTNMPG